MESRPLAEHCTCDTVFQWQTQHVTPHSLSLWLNVLSVDIRFERITYPPNEEMFKLHTVSLHYLKFDFLLMGLDIS